MKNMRKYFGEGDCVNVKYLPGEMYHHNFTGYVVEVKEEYVLVSDEDGNQWECDPGLLRHSSDEVMHRNL